VDSAPVVGMREIGDEQVNRDARIETCIHSRAGMGGGQGFVTACVRLQQPEAALATSAAWLLRAVGNRLSAGVAGAAPRLQLLGLRLAPVALIGIVSSRPAVDRSRAACAQSAQRGAHGELAAGIAPGTKQDQSSRPNACLAPQVRHISSGEQFRIDLAKHAPLQQVVELVLLVLRGTAVARGRCRQARTASLGGGAAR
jgi:hypothetical protein